MLAKGEQIDANDVHSSYAFAHHFVFSCLDQATGCSLQSVSGQNCNVALRKQHVAPSPIKPLHLHIKGHLQDGQAPCTGTFEHLLL